MSLPISRALRHTILGALLMGVFAVCGLCVAPSAHAATGINKQMNFQGRLLNAQGAVVPDGNYNIQFKIYQDGTGSATGNPGGTLKWTEDWLNSASHGVLIKNGYLSVQLGAVNPFGTQVDWDQDTLWLSINIGNTNTSCTPFTSCGGDGEMVPMKRLSSVAYAMNATMLGGRDATGFIQNTTAPQSANIAVQSANSGNIAALIQGASSQTADILQVKSSSSSTPLLSIGATGAIAVQPTVDSATLFNVKNSLGSSVMVVDTQNNRISIGNASTTGAALSVTGAVDASSEYRIAGVTTLTSSGLTFSATSTGTILGAQDQGLSIQGGNASVANTNGGNLTLSGGNGNGTGVQGLVIMSTPTFSTTVADPNCFTGGAPVGATCTIAQSSVNNSAAILVGFNINGQTATLPDPTVLTAGRVVYVTASNTSLDFTLSVNGGGQGNQIAMRKNTTATMIWNGSDWTAAGASSSTTLQAAYDNTLQSAGGAELVVSKTSSTNGLTIRDSTTNSVNGTLLSVQTSSAAGLFQVNSNVTEYATDAGAEVAGASASTFPASTWTSVGTSTISRYVTAGNYIATGQGSVAVNPTAANAGVKNTLSSALTPNMHYNVSFTTRLASGTFTDLNVYYSVDGTATSVTCATNQTSATSIWTKVNCTFTAPASGITASNAIIIRQTAGTTRTFYVDNISVTIAADYNLATDGSVDDSANFATNWTPVGGAGISWTSAAGNDASDSAQVAATAAGHGVRNKLAMNPLASTLYRITVYAASSTALSDFTVRYSRDGGTNFVACADYNTQTISTSTSAFTKVTCYITTDGTAATNPYVYFTQAAAATRTFYVDTFSMNLSSSSTPNVQIGGGTNGGPTTLFTVDRGASAPIASNNDALLGSMYYDTSLGKLQCYEADGWGACGSSPDNIITISPEYTNAVLHGTGIGTMTSDLCSDYLNINDGSSGQPTICGTNETYNFYKWTSPQATAQTYSIYVTYQLPSTFKGFNSGQTSLMARTDNGSTTGASSIVQYSILKNTPGAGTTPCGGTTTVSTGTQTTWQTVTASGSADPSTCGFAAGNSIVFKISMAVSRNANAYVGNLNFSFSNR